MTKPADKWMEKAREYVVEMPHRPPTMFDVQSVIARALEATDKAAREEEREKIFAKVFSPFAIVLLDGRNEHGSHVLLCGARSIDEACLDDLLSDRDQNGVCEQIIADAEELGFKVGDCVWAEFCWNEPQIGDFGRVELNGYWEFSKINVEMTKAAIRKGTDNGQG